MQVQSIWCSGHLPPPSTSPNLLKKNSKGCTWSSGPSRSLRTACLTSAEQGRLGVLFRRNVKWRKLRVSAAGDLAAGGNGLSYSPPPSNDLADTLNSVLDVRNGMPSEASLESVDASSSEAAEVVSSTGSTRWILGPAALIASLLLPQIFLATAIEAILKEEILSEIFASFLSEVLFYIGLRSFISVAERVQQPYLEFSKKQWRLITDHRSYLYSTYLTTGIKVFAPIFAAYLVWPVIGLPAVVAVAPFLVGLVVQYAFEEQLDNQRSSCWPILAIVFEVYRLYQLNRGAHFVERLIFSMRQSAMSRELLERSSALFSMLAVFQVLGVVCLWSLATFLLRLIPSISAAEK